MILLIALLAVGFYMAWNIGANDVSNAMGTSVGSGALTLTKAIVIAAVLEFAGAFLLGANVSETMQRGIINPEHFLSDPRILLYGMFAALLGTAIWLQVASFFGWPVSTTHAIVGSILGFGLIVGGPHTVHWNIVGSIALSWVISPAISGIFAYVLFTILQRKVLYAHNPIFASRQVIPYLTGAVFFIFVVSALFGGLKNLSWQLSTYASLSIACGAGVIGWLFAFFWVKTRHKIAYEIHPAPYQVMQHASLDKSIKHLQRLKLALKGESKEEAKKILDRVRALSATVHDQPSKQKRESDYLVVEKMFGMLQIISAAYVAFAHGANDVANAIGPVAAALEIIQSGTLSESTPIPIWLLGLGGAGIVIGLATWGWRVIQTVGKKITELTPTRGFSAEFGAAITILVASKLGLPISTTHCIVGAVLGVGMARGLSAINLRTVRDIVLSWVITIPASAFVTILLFFLIRSIFLI
ncbi:MAG: inorganic phosphate transporter [Simkaniaceae bacterium]|nr:inorganic phosphate transporter [Simkaniaceae bacterium]